MQLCFGGKADLPLGQVWETGTGDGDRREVPFPRDFEQARPEPILSDKSQKTSRLSPIPPDSPISQRPSPQRLWRQRSDLERAFLVPLNLSERRRVGICNPLLRGLYDVWR